MVTFIAATRTGAMRLIMRIVIMRIVITGTVGVRTLLRAGTPVSHIVGDVRAPGAAGGSATISA